MIPLIDDVRTGWFRPITSALIAVTVLTSLIVLHADAEAQQAWLERYAWVSPLRLSGAYRLFTANFLHGDHGHLIGNMVFLFAFGNTLEARLGTPGFLGLYFGAAATGWLAHAQVTHDGLPAIGASAGISGLIAAYLVLYPRARFLTAIVLLWIVKFVRVRAWFFITLWIGLQLWSVEHDTDSNVAYWAHLGGAGLGLVIGGFARLWTKEAAGHHEGDAGSHHHGLWRDHEPAHGAAAGVDREDP